jgi:putative acetyltransferase
MQINIKHDDLKDGKVLTLLAEHHRQMQLYSPPESIHALNQAQFFDPALTFWGAWDGDSLAACGAVKQLSETAGEIKAMRTEPKYIRQGIAAKILSVIIAEARSRQYAVLSLETGAHEAFVPAIRLYQKFGFVECEPFGDYQPDPYSRFFIF